MIGIRLWEIWLGDWNLDLDFGLELKIGIDDWGIGIWDLDWGSRLGIGIEDFVSGLVIWIGNYVWWLVYRYSNSRLGCVGTIQEFGVGYWDLENKVLDVGFRLEIGDWDWGIGIWNWG